jgi:predicted permease
MGTMWKRCLAFLRSRRLDGDLDDEIAIHLAMQEEEFRRKGMTAQAARLAARREFGGVAQAMENYRERRGLPWLEATMRDLRYAARGLRRSPGFTAAAVLSLALGIGANTATFSLFYALLLKMLPVPRPAELVTLRTRPGFGFFSYPFYEELNRRTDLFTGVAAHRVLSTVRLDAAAVRMEPVSHNYFAVLDLRPTLGRFFVDGPEDERSAVVSYRLWRRQFSADPAVLGRTVRVDGRPTTIIGVAPPGFHGDEIESRVDLWVPFKPIRSANVGAYQLLARRRPGTATRQVQSAMNVLMANRDAVYEHSTGRREKPWIEVSAGGIGFSRLRDDFARPLQILMATVLLVLLATCTNIAHLLIARGAARRKEIAVRISLGAGRARLVRQMFMESLLLAGTGSLFGVALAWWGSRALLLFVPERLTGSLDVAPDARVLLLAAVLSAMAALFFGLLPAFRSTAVDPVAGLRADSAPRKGRPMLRRALVTAQVAFSVLLVALAGLFGHSLAGLRMVDMGFRQQTVITTWLYYPDGWKDAQQRAAWRRFVAGAKTLSGVAAASYVSPDLLQVGSRPIGVRGPSSGRSGTVPLALAGPQFFQTLGTEVRLGRDFAETDAAASRKIAVVNESFVREYLDGDRNPLERVFTVGEENEPRHIVGIVPDIAHQDIRRKPLPAIYLPYSQFDDVYGNPAIVVRTSAPPAAVISGLRRQMAAMGLEVSDPQTVEHRVDESIFQERMLAAVSGFFGALALLLAAIGLYGVVAYGTAQRAGEIGIRVALGAQRPHLLWLALRDALVLVCLGLAVGLPAAIAAGRAVRSILFGTGAADAFALSFTALVLLAVGMTAAFVPARRAASMDPMRVLRTE